MTVLRRMRRGLCGATEQEIKSSLGVRDSLPEDKDIATEEVVAGPKWDR
jgi:hypothetical protein